VRLKTNKQTNPLHRELHVKKENKDLKCVEIQTGYRI
jgi:hypothetical protein